MDEKPKSIWKKSWAGWGWLRAWLMLVAATFLIGLIAYLAGGIPGGPPSLWPELFFLLTGSLIAATVFVLLWLFIRCFFNWRNFKRLLFGLACFATLIALFYAEEDWRGWHAWNNFKHEWEAKGEHFDFASVIPKPVPDDQNFALTPVVATCYAAWLDKNGNRVKPYDTNVVDRVSMVTWRDNHWAHMPKSGDWSGWPASKKTDLKPWQEYFRSPPPTNSMATNSFPTVFQPQSPAEDVLLALSKYDSAIEEIRQASQLPSSRFPLTYNLENSANIVLPHIGALNSCAQALALRSLAELQTGRSEPALTNVELSLCLANSIRTEPFLISHLVRIAILKMTLQPVYEGLAEYQWSDAQLVALDAKLAKLDFLADYRAALRGEMGMHSSGIDLLRRNRRELFNMMANGEGGPTPHNPPPIGLLIPSGWFYQNQLRLARIMVEFYLPAADENQGAFSPAAIRSADKFRSAETKKTTPYNIFDKMLPQIGTAVKKFACAQASVDLARTAMALERYRLAHGEFPESLDALAPQFIAKVPHDVIGGQPLHYRRTDDGQFVLYSVGWNEKDDGGVTGYRKGGSAPDFESGDWVWRYPAR